MQLKERTKMRRILTGQTKKELDKRINQYLDRNWIVISEVKFFGNSYEVLVEKQAD